MAFTVEHQCPQCGAPIELEETDYLLRCPYCNVKNFLFAPGCFHFLLPHKAFDKDIIYAPYMRFKGEVYFCKGTSIGHRIVDITHLGAAFKELPVSLGLRPQAMKMKFVTPDMVGSFLKCSLRAADVLAKVGRQSLIFGPGKLIHRAYIGEALSLIYLPLFVQNNRVFDAVTERLIAKVPQGADIFGAAIEENPRWKITFMATICPRCGWNLDGERDSVVLTCSNCDAAWEASEGRFVQVGFGAVPVQKHWENQAMAFWIPAFKIRPKVFLNLARQMTITQKDFEMEEKIPKKGLYPVTLPQGEAAQGMKITLASAGLSKKKIFPLLPRVSFATKESTLVYLPFNDTGHEMIQEHMGISINKNALRFGRQL